MGCYNQEKDCDEGDMEEIWDITRHELLEEFRDELLDTVVDEEVDYNLTMEIEELETLLAKDPMRPITFFECRLCDLDLEPLSFDFEFLRSVRNTESISHFQYS
ncbi:hypothetical protein Tco_1131955 [Tanacetum coccineum]|uniref:Uncharacterized protein n=1 Tax=Tanacetum coccineum TaxID=301880 RepID=A0ABQ5JB61_9ASTR